MDMTNLTTFLDTIKTAADAGVFVPSCVWGETGLGKSTAVKAAAKRWGIDCIDLRLGAMEVADFLGMMDITDGKTTYAEPTWWPKEGTSGVLFLDEINRSHRDVRAPMFQLILDRKLIKRELPKGWVVVAAANPPSGDYEVDDSYDKAWMARFCHVQLVPTVDEWLTWAASEGLHWSVRKYAEKNPGLMGLKGCVLPTIHPTARTVADLGRLMDVGLPDTIRDEVARGLMGTEAAALWLVELETQERPVRGLQVLTEWPKMADTIKEQVTDGRVDLLKGTLDDVVAIAKGEDWRPDMITGFRAFIMALPRDLGFSALRLHLSKVDNIMGFVGDGDAGAPFLTWCEECNALGLGQDEDGTGGDNG